MINTWIHLQTEGQLQALLEASHTKPVAVFKHSTRCGTSHGALHDLVEGWELKPEQLDFYYLDLLQFRPISNAIAEQLHVTHQSPQLILIYRGKAVYAASHLSVTAKGLKKALSEKIEVLSA
jgi:bacillithiol system protein YtxJ